MVAQGNHPGALAPAIAQPPAAPDDGDNARPTMPEFDAYCENELYLLDRKLASYLALPPDDRDAFSAYPVRLQALSDCILANGRFLRDLAAKGAAFLPRAGGAGASPGKGKPAGLDRGGSDGGPDAADAIVAVRGLLHAVARDWSAEGAGARAALYGPLVGAVERAHESSAAPTRADFRVLVPGAGAGRLCWELAARGFSVEGCEDSRAMILASNYFLNHAAPAAPARLHPFAHEHRDVRRAADQARAVDVPDVDPAPAPAPGADFGMRTGAFLDLYGGPDAPPARWDAVVSCFAFALDGAVVPALRAVSALLRPGGVWAFIGPRPCAHDEDLFAPQLAVSEFLDVVRKSGFRIVREEDVEVAVSPDSESLRTRTMCTKFFVAVKTRPMK